ncbi:hypothetical protein CEXT_804051 [Caerostris extrusa]|uniref:Uncharacterized protein n=1 Tax=Caerostris extrusa TaxID=172846 RepID=A0AAV4Y317_CAEEX|nr:hypothetical protein CEXT_804051 [Caerostris extrusa]
MAVATGIGYVKEKRTSHGVSEQSVIGYEQFVNQEEGGTSRVLSRATSREASYPSKVFHHHQRVLCDQILAKTKRASLTGHCVG